MRLMRMPPSGALVTLKGNNFKSSCAKKKNHSQHLSVSSLYKTTVDGPLV